MKNQKHTPKAWNGGSVERALDLARERVGKLITQGASLCDECNGEGGTLAAGVCIQCRGAGVILPPEGLSLEGLLPTREEAAEAARVLLRCNGHDLSQWTDDDWPDHDAEQALRALAKAAPEIIQDDDGQPDEMTEWRDFDADC